jgi:hypothetical protein
MSGCGEVERWQVKEGGEESGSQRNERNVSRCVFASSVSQRQTKCPDCSRSNRNVLMNVLEGIELQTKRINQAQTNPLLNPTPRP